MNTISDILMDIDRGCLTNNMIEDCFTYRIVYFVNEGNNGKKYYLDSSYRDLRKSLESIIRGNLTLTNNVVIAETTVLKRGECTCLQSRSYSFNLEEYFKRIKGECNSNRNNQYCRYTMDRENGLLIDNQSGEIAKMSNKPSFIQIVK